MPEAAREDQGTQRVDVRTVLREHAVFLSLAAAYLASAILLSAIGVIPSALRMAVYVRVSAVMLPFFLAGAFAVLMARVILIDRPEKPFEAIWQALRNARLGDRFLIALPILLAMPLFASAFTRLKASLLVVRPEIVDVALARLDRAVHGGIDPWLLLQPVLGFSLVTSVIDALYKYWMAVVILMWFWQAFSLRDRHLRQRFFVSFLLCWILLGTILAYMMPSVGPCYYGRATGLPDDFAALAEYLRGVPESYGITALATQDWLWTLYRENRLTIGAGISAMPSMHVSFAFLFALVGWRVHRVAGLLLSFYAAVIMLGSVHLGWHYAIDGYVSVVATALIWWCTGRIQRRPVTDRHTQHVRP